MPLSLLRPLSAQHGRGWNGPPAQGVPKCSRPTQTCSGPLPTFQSNCGPAHIREGLSHSVICRYMPWGEEADNGLQLLSPPQIRSHSEIVLCSISWGIHVLLHLPNDPSPDITPVMDGLGSESTWPKHILHSQIFPSLQNKNICQKWQTHNSNLLTLVNDKDTEQPLSLDSLVSCVNFIIFNYLSVPTWTLG